MNDMEIGQRATGCANTKSTSLQLQQGLVPNNELIGGVLLRLFKQLHIITKVLMHETLDLKHQLNISIFSDNAQSQKSVHSRDEGEIRSERGSQDEVDCSGRDHHLGQARKRKRNAHHRHGEFKGKG